MRTAAYIAAVLLLAFSYPYLKAYYNDSHPSPEEQSDPSILIPKEARIVDLGPRIIMARVLEERPNKLRIGLEYIIPKTAPEGDYSLSVHPDMSHWSYSRVEVVKGGRQYAEITISFRAQKEGVTEAKSKKLLFYFGRAKDNYFIETLGNRDVAFPKTWRAVP